MPLVCARVQAPISARANVGTVVTVFTVPKSTHAVTLPSVTNMLLVSIPARDKRNVRVELVSKATAKNARKSTCAARNHVVLMPRVRRQDRLRIHAPVSEDSEVMVVFVTKSTHAKNARAHRNLRALRLVPDVIDANVTLVIVGLVNSRVVLPSTCVNSVVPVVMLKQRVSTVDPDKPSAPASLVMKATARNAKQPTRASRILVAKANLANRLDRALTSVLAPKATAATLKTRKNVSRLMLVQTQLKQRRISVVLMPAVPLPDLANINASAPLATKVLATNASKLRPVIRTRARLMPSAPTKARTNSNVFA